MNAKSRKSIFKQPAWLAAVMLVFVILVAACAPAATPVPTAIPTMVPAPTSTTAPTMVPATPTTAATATPAAPAEATINVATDPKLGKILVDGKGMTLYMYTKDAPDVTNCTGGCLTAWPPLLTSGSPKLGDGVDKALVGSAKMADGKMIVTYNKMPLYYYAKDTKAGDVVGQNVGGVWYVVSPEGKVIGFEATLKVATDPKLGKILVDARGMTLYMYTKDEADKVNCAGGCLTAWPPLLTQGTPTLGEGVDKALVGYRHHGRRHQDRDLQQDAAVLLRQRSQSR